MLVIATPLWGPSSIDAAIRVTGSIAGLAALLTAVWKTTWFDNLFHGVALISLTIATSLGMLAVGTHLGTSILRRLGAVEEDVGSFGLWFVATMHGLLLEVSTESTPTGERTVTLLERDRNLVSEDEGALVHSVYNDPRAHLSLVRWLLRLAAVE